MRLSNPYSAELPSIYMPTAFPTMVVDRTQSLDLLFSSAAPTPDRPPPLHRRQQRQQVLPRHLSRQAVLHSTRSAAVMVGRGQRLALRGRAKRSTTGTVSTRRAQCLSQCS